MLREATFGRTNITYLLFYGEACTIKQQFEIFYH